MTFLLVGISHRTAPLDLREQLAIPPYDLPVALDTLRANVGVCEAVILSTCNRVELYVASADPAATFPNLVDSMSHYSHLPPEAFQARLYRFTGCEAVRHLFRVAAGLDSMVFGESEITAQVKQAYLIAHAQGTTGPVLNRVFQKAFHSVKVIRSQTRISEGQASIGSVVVALANERFGERLTSCEVLLWGAGKVAEATARHLIKRGIGQLWIVSRTPAKAQDLALLCQSGWLSWEQALKHLAHVDIAIVCTQAPHYIIDAGDLETILPQRRGRPLVLIDLAVPRNVDPAIAGQPGLVLYNIDHLQAVTQATLARRREELDQCAALISQQVEHFSRWWEARSNREGHPCRAVAAFSSV